MKNRFIYLFIVIFIIIFINGVKSYATYFSANSGRTEKLSFAKFVFENQELNEINLLVDKIVPGKYVDYDFLVSNSKGNVVSDVNIKYNIIIETYKLLPINIYLYDSNNNLLVDCGDANERSKDNKIVCTSRNLNLSKDDVSSNNFRVRVDFPVSDASGNSFSSEYSGQLDYIDIKLKSYQNIVE